jgi:hypothetical protein
MFFHLFHLPKGAMTIYGMYVQNGNRAGLWVQHRTWNNVCALVQRIGGQESGKLPGRAPLHDHAPVQAKAFDVRSGRPLATDQFNVDPADRGFVAIAQPPWAHTATRALVIESFAKSSV